MANNLKDHLKEVADAIRAKKGTSDLINPQDFSAEIAPIEGGGSGGGESILRYFLISPFIECMQAQGMLSMLPQVLVGSPALGGKGQDGILFITPPAYLGEQYYNEVDRCAIVDDFIGLIDYSNEQNTQNIISQLLALGCTEITKEQFYDLNA